MSDPTRSRPRRTFVAWLDWRWPVILKYAGLLLAVYEVVPFGDNFLHPSALVVAGGMMGLESVINRNGKGPK